MDWFAIVEPYLLRMMIVVVIVACALGVWVIAASRLSDRD
jgi:hypothetical protein